MSILAGIDEAGYGPLLGPLVVSSVVFEIPKQNLNQDLWNILKASVSKNKKNQSGRLLIIDSKKAYNRKTGINQLERTTLTFLKSLGKTEPLVLSQLLKSLCPVCFQRITQYPWYQKIESRQLTYNKTDIDIASDVLNRDLQDNDISFIDLQTRCLDVGYFNDMVSRVKNKSRVLFSAVAEFIQSIYEQYGDEDLHIIVDRQGGRSKYRRILQTMFPGTDLTILCENAKISSYELVRQNKRMRLHFVVEGDSKFLPVALSSMVSKYIRELLVEHINNYFLSFCDNLKPTAGYWKDGQRFIREIETKVPHLHYDAKLLVRCR